MLPYVFCGVLVLALISLSVKIHLMQKSLHEICAQMSECLQEDTNALLVVSSGDRYVKRLAAELNRHIRLLRAQRLQYQTGNRELKEAITGLSHDLRTPLTVICGYLELLEEEEKSPDAARYLLLIAQRARTLKTLTEELFRYLLCVSREDELSLEPVNLNAALEESIATFYDALKEKGISPVVSMPSGQITRRLNRDALFRVLSNLMSNVLKYSQSDLEITLHESGEICFANTARALDTISVGRLFDRFFSVEGARHSTGLGLAIAKTLVERMRGEIEAQYIKGKLFIRIRFPEERR